MLPEWSSEAVTCKWWCEGLQMVI